MRDCFRNRAKSKKGARCPSGPFYQLAILFTLISLTSCSSRVAAPELSSPVQVTSQSQPVSDPSQLGQGAIMSDRDAEAAIDGACVEAWRKELAGDEKGAVKQLNDLDRKYPRVSTVRFMLGQVMEHSGKKQEAIKYYHEAVGQSDFDSLHLFKLAEALRTTGNAEGAIPYYRKLLKGAPQFTAGQLGLAKALLDVEPKSPEALGILHQIVKDDPKNKEALAALAGKH